MTNRSTVDSETILGLNYQVINLTSNEYNPQIDDEITLTCEVLDVYSDPVEGYEVQLYKNGTSMGSSYSGSSNSSGIITFNVNCDEWGLMDYSIENNHCQVNVTGFKQIKSYSSGFYTLAVDGSTRTAIVSLNSTNKNFVTGENYKETEFIPPEYVPPANMYSLFRSGTDIRLYVLTNGTVACQNNSGSNINGLTASTSIYYHY